jgi:hypothetical protein
MNKGDLVMKKGKLMGKSFGIALGLVMVEDTPSN